MAEWMLMHKKPGRSVALALFLAVALSSGRIAAQDRPVLSLDKAVEMALQADAQVLAARNDLEKAKLGEKQGVLATLPQITFEGEQSYGLDTRTQPQTQNYTIKIKETLPTGVHLYGEGVAADAEVSRWDRERNEKEYQIRRAEVRYNTAVLYFAALKAERTLRYQEAALKNAREAAAVAEKQLALGKITKPDQLSAEIDLAQAGYELEKSRRDYALALKQLANQIGVSDPESLLLDENLPSDPLAGLNYEQMKEAAVQKRPEIRQARIDIQKAERVVAQAKNQSLPELTFSYQDRNAAQGYSLGYSFLSGDLTGVIARQKQNGNNNRTTDSDVEYLLGSTQKITALQVACTLDWGIARSQVQQAVYDLENSQRSLEQSSRDISLEIDQAISDYELAAAQLKIKREALPLYQKKLELAQMKQKLERATALEVSQAELALMSARMEADNANGNLLAAAEKVRLTLGELYD